MKDERIEIDMDKLFEGLLKTTTCPYTKDVKKTKTYCRFCNKLSSLQSDIENRISKKDDLRKHVLGDDIIVSDFILSVLLKKRRKLVSKFDRWLNKNLSKEMKEYNEAKHKKSLQEELDKAINEPIPVQKLKTDYKKLGALQKQIKQQDIRIKELESEIKRLLKERKNGNNN